MHAMQLLQSTHSVGVLSGELHNVFLEWSMVGANLHHANVL
jgi:hypothetical protein